MNVVAGGGPAGAACACLLARGKKPVLLIEREAAPVHKVCGEFISTEAQHYLAAIGFSPAAHGARPIGRVRLVHGTRVAEAALPFAGLSLTRRTLDEALLRHAAGHGVSLLRGHAIRAVRSDGAVTLEVAGAGDIAAKTLFLATGKHDLRGLRRVLARPPEDLVGFKSYFAVSRRQATALDFHVEVILFPGGYAGLQMVEGGVANLCLLVDRAVFTKAGRCWDGLLAHLTAVSHHLARRLDGAASRLDHPLSIFRVPYGFLHEAAATDRADVYRLGDQVGVIPSFSGDGIAIALHSAHVAANMFLDGGSAPSYHHRMRGDLGGQLALASLIYRGARLPFGAAMLTAVAWAFPWVLQAMAMKTRVKIDTAAQRTGDARWRTGFG